MQKNLTLIVGGVPRSGKTTLCRRIAHERRLSHVSLDALIHAFEKAFPQIGISHDAVDFNELCVLIRPFLFEHLRWLTKFEIPFILDAYYLRPRDVEDLQTQGGFRAVFLGYPFTSPQERLNLLRANERDGDWTKLFSDDVMLSNIEAFIRASSRMKEWCEAAGQTFIDVSNDWENQLEQAYQQLMR